MLNSLSSEKGKMNTMNGNVFKVLKSKIQEICDIALLLLSVYDTFTHLKYNISNSSECVWTIEQLILQISRPTTLCALPNQIEKLTGSTFFLHVVLTFNRSFITHLVINRKNILNIQCNKIQDKYKEGKIWRPPPTIFILINK